MTEYEQFKIECNNEIVIQNNTELWQKTHNWMFADGMRHYSYHFEWLGRPIIQYPQDIVQFQEIVWKTKPDLIIETGIAHGGSLILSASLLALLDLINPAASKRMVLGIDIDIRKHNREAIETHPLSGNIIMYEGSSTNTDIVKKVKEYSKDYNSVMVCLDSNHTYKHVLDELELFAPLVSTGNYCIVWDTIIEEMPDNFLSDRPWGKGNNPKTSVFEFLKTHKEFEIDKEIQQKLLITVAPDGYLKKVK